ncbi:unnamed protein product [Vicia faba]|uniref:Reverse transcriptase n=1 Tax=Vicia faba TaxID=3906 RepID=A0AAV0ZA02_VICFA|nr:unnamed protein product [Vicia faba]
MGSERIENSFNDMGISSIGSDFGSGTGFGLTIDVNSFSTKPKGDYVLENGSPTNGFKLERGLRQGDSLSPFLFLLATERLHVLMNALVKKGMYTWYGVRAQNENGGLEVRRLKEFNLALLDKWCWRILNATESLLYKVLSAQYGEEEGYNILGVAVDLFGRGI